MLQYPLYEFITNKKPKQGLITKTFISIFILFYILTYINEYFITSNSFNTYIIYKDIEITRLISSLFISESILSLILNIFFTLTLINYYENTEGSVYFLKNFIFSTLLFELFLLSILYILSFLCPYILIMNISIYKYILISFLVKQILVSDGKFIYSYILNRSNTRFLFVLLLFSIFLMKNNMNYIINEAIIVITSIIYGILMAKHEVFFTFKQFNHYILVVIDSNQVLREVDCFISLNSLLKIRPKVGSECGNKRNGFNSNSTIICDDEKSKIDLEDYNCSDKIKASNDIECGIDVSIS